MLAAIERGEVEVIVVTEMTRLYRRIEELLDLIKMAEHTRLRGIWTTDGIGYDLGTPEGIHAAIAAVNNAMLESAKLSKRGKRKKKARAEAGHYLGGTRAYGYEGAVKDGDGNILNRGRINVAVVEHEAEVFKACVTRVIAGERVTTIMYDLNKKDIPAAQGGQWGIGNFKKTLIEKRRVIFDDSDPEQHGTLVHNGQEYRAAWPGFITRDQYALMMARFNEAAAERKGYRRVYRHAYLLSGLIFCGTCGCAMCGSGGKRPGGNSERRYRCRLRDHYGNVIGCGKVFRAADPIEDLVIEAVLKRLDVPEVARALMAGQDDDGVSALVEALAVRRKHRANLVVEYGRGEHTKDDYKIMLAAADETIEAAEAEVSKHLSSQTAAQLPTDRALRGVWDEASKDWRAEVIKLLVEKIVVLPGGRGSRRYKEWRFNPEYVRIEWKLLNEETRLSVAALITGQRRVHSVMYLTKVVHGTIANGCGSSGVTRCKGFGVVRVPVSDPAVSVRV